MSLAACNGLEHFLPAAPAVETDDGQIRCRMAALGEEELEKAQLILGTMVLGIEQIQAEYGREYIVIDRRRWTPC